jgi:hypothetical protein
MPPRKFCACRDKTARKTSTMYLKTMLEEENLMNDLQIVVGRSRADAHDAAVPQRADKPTASPLFGVPHLGVFDWEGCRCIRLALLTRKAIARPLHLTLK